MVSSASEERRTGLVADLRWPAALATAALAATGLADIVAVAFDWDRYALIGRIESGALVTLSEADTADHRQAIMGLVQFGLFVVTAIVFIWWFRRAYGNVDALGGERRFSPAWAIGGWFVPVLNLWRPKQIANDLWQTSDPDDPDWRWSTPGVSPLVTWWWLAFLASSWLSARAYRASDGTTAHELRTATVIYLVGDCVDIVAVCLAVAVVLRLTSRQRQRADARLQGLVDPDGLPGWGILVGHDRREEQPEN